MPKPHPVFPSDPDYDDAPSPSALEAKADRLLEQRISDAEDRASIRDEAAEWGGIDRPS